MNCLILLACLCSAEPKEGAPEYNKLYVRNGIDYKKYVYRRPDGTLRKYSDHTNDPIYARMYSDPSKSHEDNWYIRPTLPGGRIPSPLEQRQKPPKVPDWSKSRYAGWEIVEKHTWYNKYTKKVEWGATTLKAPPGTIYRVWGYCNGRRYVKGHQDISGTNRIILHPLRPWPDMRVNTGPNSKREFEEAKKLSPQKYPRKSDPPRPKLPSEL